MSELYMMVTITNRQLTRKFVECYKENGAQVGSVTVGMGTAANEILDYFGLDGMEKSVLFHLVTDAAWRQIKPALRKKMQIDLPGMGIAFIIPVSSVGGKKALNYLTCGQEFVKGEESTLKETKNELLVVIANHGYTELVMDAERSTCGRRHSHPCQGHRNRECTAVSGRDTGAGKRNVVHCGKK